MKKSIFHKNSSPAPERYLGTIIDREHRIVVLNSYNLSYSLSKLINSKIEGRVDIICGIWWSIENLKNFTKIIFTVYRNRILFPNIKIHLLCNTQKEYRYLRRLGFRCVYCNQNAFVDEHIFKILPGVKKLYSASYNAVLREFKRHYLCKDLKNIALVTYNFNNIGYLSKVKEILKSVTWINYLENESSPRFLSNNELTRIYNESHVGLALSKTEGAMYASIEYLLCGIPVVSTVSKGGRDIFFNQENSAICLDTKEDVKLKVDEMMQRNINPVSIRNNTIELMKEHRNIFISYVNEIYKERGIEKDIRLSWNDWYINKLRNEYTPDQIIEELR